MHCDTGSYGAKGQLSGDTPVFLAHFSCVANGSAHTNTNPQTQSPHPRRKDLKLHANSSYFSVMMNSLNKKSK